MQDFKLKTRDELLKIEEQILAPYAMKSSLCSGRVHKEPSDKFRLPFQKDRDRIMHCKSFRRLQAKTQVFVSYFGDHYRDRMTHSIEVSQISRDISRALGLNEDLSECLALAHDLGHPPFGHGGESAIDEALKEFGLNFEHNEQSRRIIEKLEKPYPNFDGLNVTKEVLDGLLKHNPHKYKTYSDFEISAHLEGQLVDLSDEIAYVNHDADDGIRSGLITTDQISKFKVWKDAQEQVFEIYGEVDQKRFVSRVISKMIGKMIQDLQSATMERLKENNINSIEKVRSSKIRLVDFSEAMRAEINDLRKFLIENFYYNKKVADQIENGKKIIKKLFLYYLKNPQDLPEEMFASIQSGERPEIMIKDYIAGMTDHFAEEKFKEYNLS